MIDFYSETPHTEFNKKSKIETKIDDDEIASEKKATNL